MTETVWGFIVLIVAAGFLFDAWRLYRARVRFLRNAVRAQATVVGVRVDGTGRNAVSVPTFEYQLPDGSVQRAEPLQPSGFTGAAPGHSMPILYDPADPSRADRDLFWALWGLAVLRAGFGCVFALIGFVAMMLS